MKDQKDKNPYAVALGKKRWEGKSDQEKKEHLTKMFEARKLKPKPKSDTI